MPSSGRLIKMMIGSVTNDSRESLQIRRADDHDWDQIWPIFARVVASGDTYVYDPQMSECEARALWMPSGASTYVAEWHGHTVGTYRLQANQPGLGSHVANAAYMVHPDARRRGIGERLCRHSLTTARAHGYLAMQFNCVVRSNATAVALWKRLGFHVVGIVPSAFRHARLGYVDALVMHQFLDGEGHA